jgi:hypothetical protein
MHDKQREKTDSLHPEIPQKEKTYFIPACRSIAARSSGGAER